MRTLSNWSNTKKRRGLVARPLRHALTCDPLGGSALSPGASHRFLPEWPTGVYAEAAGHLRSALSSLSHACGGNCTGAWVPCAVYAETSGASYKRLSVTAGRTRRLGPTGVYAEAAGRLRSAFSSLSHAGGGNGPGARVLTVLPLRRALSMRRQAARPTSDALISCINGHARLTCLDGNEFSAQHVFAYQFA